MEATTNYFSEDFMDSVEDSSSYSDSAAGINQTYYYHYNITLIVIIVILKVVLMSVWCWYRSFRVCYMCDLICCESPPPDPVIVTVRQPVVMVDTMPKPNHQQQYTEFNNRCSNMVLQSNNNQEKGDFLQQSNLHQHHLPSTVFVDSEENKQNDKRRLLD